jgi:hypothetical protein
LCDAGVVNNAPQCLLPAKEIALLTEEHGVLIDLFDKVVALLIQLINLAFGRCHGMIVL